VRCSADGRQALQRLCRYVTRPALANERVQTNGAGQVVLKLKTSWRDGTTHLVMSPLEFMLHAAADCAGATPARALRRCPAAALLDQIGPGASHAVHAQLHGGRCQEAAARKRRHVRIGMVGALAIRVPNAQAKGRRRPTACEPLPARCPAAMASSQHAVGH
jgi:hypothetical protein